MRRALQHIRFGINFVEAIYMRNQTNRPRNKAFTLIELLVVISIILIASSVIFIGGNGGGGAKLSSSQRIVSGIAQGARGQAILKNARTRLIIYADTAEGREDDKYLRFFGIIYESAPDSNQWVAATQGTFLPEGIYFDSARSSAKSSWPEAKEKHQYPFIVPKSGGSGQDYYYYEFNSNGTMATGFDNAWLVLRANALKPDSNGKLDVDFEAMEEDDPDKYIAAALIFRHAGTTTKVSEPSIIVD